MIKRMRIEPISTYLERYRKGGVARLLRAWRGPLLNLQCRL